MPEVRADLVLDGSSAEDVINGIGDQLEAIFGAPTTIDLTADLDLSEAESSIAALGGELIELPVDVQTDAASAEVSAIGEDAGPIDLGEVQLSTDEASGEVEDLGSSLEDAGGKTDEFKESAGGAETAAIGLGSGLSKGIIGAVGLSIGIDSATSSAISGVDAAERLKDAFGFFADVALKTPAPLNNIKTSIHDLGHEMGITFAQTDLLRTQTFQFAEGIGLSGLRALEYSDRMFVLASSVHAVHPELGDINTIAQTLEKRLGTGSQALNKYGISIDKSAIATRVWENQLAGLNEGLNPNQAKALAGAQLAWEKYGSSAQANVEAGIDKPSTKLDKLKASFEDFLGSVVAPVAIPVLDGISNWVDDNLTSGKLLKSFTDDFLHPIGQAGSDFANAFGSVGSAVVTSAEGIHDGVSAAVSAVADFGHSVVDVGGDVAHGFAQGVTSVHDFASTLTSTVADIGSSIGSKAADIGNRIGDGITNGVNVAKAAVSGLVGAIGGIVGKTVNIGVTGVEGAIGLVRSLIGAIAGVVGKAVNVGVSGVEGAIGLVSSLIGTIGSLVGKVVNVATSGTEAAIGLVSSLIGTIGSLIGKTVSVVADVSGIDKVRDLISAIAGVVGKTVSIGVDISGGAVEKVKDFLSHIASGGYIQAAARGATVGNVGQTFLVGEEGPELFFPDVPGTIVPHGDTKNLLADGGGEQTAVFNVNIDARGATREAVNDLKNIDWKKLKKLIDTPGPGMSGAFLGGRK